MKFSKLSLITWMLAVLLAITAFQSYQIATLGSDSTGTKRSSGVSAEQILAEITPAGVPDYGSKADVSYERVESGLKTLTGYHSSVSLSGEQQARYVEIATTEDTACEFCCGIGNAGFGTSSGQIACGCSHNYAFSGLTKWLIKNTEYSNKEIVNEIQNWKILFFPEGSLEEELEERNIEPGTAGLPSMVGGC